MWVCCVLGVEEIVDTSTDTGLGHILPWFQHEQVGTYYLLKYLLHSYYYKMSSSGGLSKLLLFTPVVSLTVHHSVVYKRRPSQTILFAVISYFYLYLFVSFFFVRFSLFFFSVLNLFLLFLFPSFFSSSAHAKLCPPQRSGISSIYSLFFSSVLLSSFFLF